MQVQGQYSTGRTTNQGLAEGATNSLTLYIYNINNLATAIEEEIQRWEDQTKWVGLVAYMEVILAILLFCDNVALVAAEQEALERFFEVTTQWLQEDRSKLQPVKTR